MLKSPDGRFVVSHLGWVDQSSLWVYDAAQDSIKAVPVGNARYLSLYPCKDPNQFAVFHHANGASLRLTVHAFGDPAHPLCAIEHSKEGTTVEGDIAALQNAPRYYTAFYNPGADADYCLVDVDASRANIETEHFDWYGPSYDKDYQGIIEVIQLPSGKLIVSVQRDSNPIVYDPDTRTVLGKLTLAGRCGNPKFRFAEKRAELWADDYDTILKFDIDTLDRKRSRSLQPMGSGTAQFIGDWSFDEDESLCLVARPFRGDVVAISTENLKTKFAAKTGRQPLQATFLSAKKVIARDWKTGELLTGTLERSWL